MWGRMESCGGLATRLERRLPGYPLGRAQINNLPHKARAGRACRDNVVLALVWGAGGISEGTCNH